MTLTRPDPMRDFVSLREAMDRLLEDSFIRPSGLLTGDGWRGAAPCDLYQANDEFVPKASLAGISPDDIEVNATSDSVTIRGEFKADAEVKQEQWVRQERRFGTFQRTFGLPAEIDPNKVEATFEHGALTLALPKAEAVRPKQIKVKAGQAIEARAR